jgi:hypothetical protein
MNDFKFIVSLREVEGVGDGMKLKAEGENGESRDERRGPAGG